ncbi:hypothetical protein Mgra_00006558 [Meloidogyne graminicola]|uniref:Uncharacterized protein n=1 Tax=Meloidogyne graminicola TaxID=189291 RepID=A0A8S9ZL64_9BILA|nr:hypothetical protein Mgra_00006558 [Meloidogyne graminicola]
MKILILISFIILLTLNCFDLIFGMDPFKDKGKGKMVDEDSIPIQKYYSQPVDEPNLETFPKIKFSLIELSLLIKILNSCSLDIMPDFSQKDAFTEFKNTLLYEFGKELLLKEFNKTFDERSQKGIKSFTNKIKELIFFYSTIIDAYEIEINSDSEDEDYDPIFDKHINIGGKKYFLYLEFIFNCSSTY